jgi:D-aminoacyl-tRNA deacylase
MVPGPRPYDPAMRVVLQRVRWARVEVAGRPVGAIDAGLLALVGVAEGDDGEDARRLADKTVRLRLFAGDGRPFDRALTEVPGAGLLCVSQFTLLADVRRGNRPSWSRAAGPDLAAPLVEAYAGAVAGHGVPVATGVFGAEMAVSLENDGPVTLVLDSGELSGPRR